MTMRLISSAIAENGKIPLRFTCDGADVSPPLAWTGAPSAARSFAIICSDPDAPAGIWFHWAIFDIPARTTDLPERYPADNGTARQAINDFHRKGYGGPCPPPGHGRHHYHFKLYAIDVERLDLPPSASCRDVEGEAAVNALAIAELIGVYSR